MVTVRGAGEADLPAILAIYNDAVANTTAIWNDALVDLENRRIWWRARRDAGFPVIVAVESGERSDEVLGYASYGPFRAWPAYKYTVEHSVYVDARFRGQGVGRRLLEAVIAAAEGQDYHVMVGGIDASNSVSIRLHESLGFELSGIVKQAGFKFGRWLDLALYQLILRTPKAPVDG